jgi:hypothetical protein
LQQSLGFRVLGFRTQGEKGREELQSIEYVVRRREREREDQFPCLVVRDPRCKNEGWNLVNKTRTETSSKMCSVDDKICTYGEVGEEKDIKDRV